MSIDLDSAEDATFFEEQWQTLNNLLPEITTGAKVKIWKSKTRGHKHALITFPKREIDIQRRILLAAILGSDRRRELLNLCRVVLDQPFPILFFERR